MGRGMKYGLLSVRWKYKGLSYCSLDGRMSVDVDRLPVPGHRLELHLGREYGAPQRILTSS